MATLLAPAREVDVPPSRRGERLSPLEHAAVGGLLLWWALPMTRALGGRGPGATGVGLLLAVVAALAVRVHARSGRLVLALAVAVGCGALAMCAFSPTGWYGSDDFAAYVLAALTVAVVRSYCTSASRRAGVLLAVALAGAAQFVQAFFPWWGGGDPSAPLVGTFYWWNPFAAFLLPGDVIGLALAVRGQGPTRLLGWLCAPLCGAGIVLSSSRASTALLVAAALALLLLGVRTERSLAVLGRWAAAVAVTAVVSMALTGPPFFDHRVGLGAAASAKAQTGQSLETNGAYRLQFWARAEQVVLHRPLVGSGAHGLVGASAPDVPASYARSNLVHNGYLQALSDGGLALGLPFLLACTLALGAFLRLAWSSLSPGPERHLRAAVAVAGLALLAHSFVDFDWSHPSDLVLTAILLGTALAYLPARPTSRLLYVPLILLAATAGAAVGHWDGTSLDVGAVRGTPSAVSHELRGQGSQPLRDYRWGKELLRRSVGQRGPLSLGGYPKDDVVWALADTRRAAEVDPLLQALRLRGQAAVGELVTARRGVEQLRTQLKPERFGPVADALSWVLQASGERPGARGVVVRYLQPGNAQDPFVGQHLETLLRLDAAAGLFDEVDRCAYEAVPATARTPETPDPGPPARDADCSSTLMGAAL